MTTETKDMIKPTVRTLADALKEKLSISADGVPTWSEGAVETATGGKADAFQEAYAQYQVLVPAMALAVGEKALETFKDLDAAQAGLNRHDGGRAVVVRHRHGHPRRPEVIGSRWRLFLTGGRQRPCAPF